MVEPERLEGVYGSALRVKGLEVCLRSNFVPPMRYGLSMYRCATYTSTYQRDNCSVSYERGTPVPEITYSPPSQLAGGLTQGLKPEPATQNALF